MTSRVETLLGRWDGEEVIVRHDQLTNAWIVIAIHSTRLGPAAGGTRMKPYESLADAVEDAQRLAEGMTYKFAIADLPRGGGKAVLAVPQGLRERERADLLRRYGALIAQLGGLYQTGPDVGTSAVDMDVIAETGAPYVFGRTPDHGGSGDSGPATAVGVLAGMRVTCERLFGQGALAGRSVVVQGAGSVGLPLLRLLLEEGADVAFADAAPEACERAHAELGLRAIAPEEVYDRACDIFAPCALGGILNERTIPRLRCRAVVGSANNQLASEGDAVRLRDRGILYAPDYVVNCGGAMALLGRETLGWSHEEADARIAATVRATLAQIYALADAEDVPTDEAARIVADARLERGPASASAGRGGAAM